MKVTSSKNATFPKFGWSIGKGETKDLPSGKEAEEAICSRIFITKVGSEKKETKSDDK